MSKTTRGALLLILGLVLLAAGSALYLMNEHQDKLAGETAGILLEQLQFNDSFGSAIIESPKPGLSPKPAVEPAQTEPAEELEQTVTPPESMPSKLVSGYEIVGILRIPSAGVELPILDNWDYDRLKISPCRYSGSLAGGDLILMGHNYRSHFKPLYQAEPGMEVEFEDVNGDCYRYVVERIDTIKGTAVEKLPSGYPLSLFTCTSGGQSRLVVRCQAILP